MRGPRFGIRIVCDSGSRITQLDDDLSPTFPSRLSGDDAYRLAQRTWRPRLAQSVRIELPGTSEAVGHARRAVELHLGGAVEDARIDDLRLLVSEVVTNAIKHGDGATGVVVYLAAVADCVRVEVCDGGSGFEFPRRPRTPDQDGGYGLRLLDAIAARWGVAGDERTCVWFELDLGTPPPQAPAGR